MRQKQIILTTVCMVAASLFLPAGCSEQKTESITKTGIIAGAVKSGEVKTETAGKSSNLIFNTSFEKGRIFNSGIYKKGRYSIEKPDGWSTRGQILNDFTGWAINEAHTGRHSLEIENTAGTDSCWEGEPIIFKYPANAFKASIWTKTKDIKGKGRIELVFDVYTMGENGKEVKERIAKALPATNSNGQVTEEDVLFADNVIKIVPFFYFEGVGAVWFDDLCIRQCEAVLGDDIVPNGNINGTVDSWILARKTPGSVLDYNNGNYSLKIVNELRSTHWDTAQIPIIAPAKYFCLEGCVKADEWTGNEGDHTQIEAMFFYKDGARSEYYPIDYPKGAYNWLKKSRHIALPDYPAKVKIVMISSGKGAVWFDNIKLYPIYLKAVSKK
jgi:hypothetical protein